MNNKKYEGVLYPTRDVSDIKEMLRTSSRLYKNKAAYLVKDIPGTDFRPITFGQLREDVDALGTKFLDMGLKGKKIAIIGNSRYNWLLTYFAVICGVGVIVPLDRNLPANEIVNLVKRANASAIVFDKSAQKRIMDLIDGDNVGIEYFISMSAEEDQKTEHNTIHSITKLVSEGKLLVRDGEREYVDMDINPNIMAALLFTSGTTGASKGVMLSHKNLIGNVINMSKYVSVPDGEIVLSILPVHHVYEMTCTYLTCIYQGATVAISEGFKYIQKNLSELNASIILGVPLIFEKMHRSIFRKAEGRGEAERLRKAIDLSRRLGLYKNKRVIRRMFNPIHQMLGNNIQLLIAGGAASDPKIIEDFEAMGLPMIQGYGMTECSPIIAVNQDRYSKADSVGKPLPKHEVHIVEEDEFGVGEIIVRGPSVMLGYYEDEEETEKVLRNGWLYTGDYGYFDDDGFLYITGRKKNVIVTKGGKNIFPEEVEQLIHENQLVEEVMVHGVEDERIGNVAITADIYPNYALLEETQGELTESEIYHLFKEYMDTINGMMPPYKHIKRINIRKTPFEKTTTGKIKRFKAGLNSNSGDGESFDYVKTRKKAENRALEKIRQLQINNDPIVRYRDSRPVVNLKAMIESSVAKYGDNVALMQKFDESQPYGEVTYKDMMAHVNGLGTALINRGLKGEKIAIIGDNCYQWIVTFLAVASGAGVVVPVDKSLNTEQITKTLKKADVRAVIVQDKYIEKLSTENELWDIITFEKYNMEGDDFSKVVKEGMNQIAKGDRQYIDARIDPSETAVLLRIDSEYDDSFKLAILSHGNFVDNIMSAPTIVKVNQWDVFFSMLPLHLAYEITCGFLIPLYKGAALAFCDIPDDPNELKNNMQDVKPTIIVAMPSIIESMRRRLVKEAIRNSDEAKLRRYMSANRYFKRIGLSMPKKFAMDMKAYFGGNLRLIISGGNNINNDSLEFLQNMGILAIQGFGVPECSPIIAINPDVEKDIRNNSVGHILPGYGVAIRNKDKDGNGEIWVRSDSVMQGYYKDEEATDAVLVSGWFDTRYIGALDVNDFLYVRGNSKNTIKIGDEEIYPEEIEAKINSLQCIKESMVWNETSYVDGDVSEQDISEKNGKTYDYNRAYKIIASVVLDMQEVEEIIGVNTTKEQLHELVWDGIDKINEEMPNEARIRKIIIRKDSLARSSARHIIRSGNHNKEENE